MSADGPDGRRHVFPLEPDMPDLAHEATHRVVRTRPDDRCLLCAAGRCWQNVRPDGTGEMVVHGTVVA